MSDIIRIYLKFSFIISAFVYVCIFLKVIIPTIKTNRKIYWSDWLGKNFNTFAYLEEYKTICKKNDLSLIWYKLCWGLFFFLLVSIIVCFIIYTIQ